MSTSLNVCFYDGSLPDLSTSCVRLGYIVLHDEKSCQVSFREQLTPFGCASHFLRTMRRLAEQTKELPSSAGSQHMVTADRLSRFGTQPFE